MTREEIEKLAKQIVNDVEGVNSYERSYGYVTEDLVALVRATLLEAARAVCGGWEYGHPDGEGYRYGCAAAPIHDLIAELDKEADRERAGAA